MRGSAIAHFSMASHPVVYIMLRLSYYLKFSKKVIIHQLPLFNMLFRVIIMICCTYGRYCFKKDRQTGSSNTVGNTVLYSYSEYIYLIYIQVNRNIAFCITVLKLVLLLINLPFLELFIELLLVFIPVILNNRSYVSYCTCYQQNVGEYGRN